MEHIVLKYHKWVLLFFLSITGLLAIQLPSLQKNPSSNLLPETHKSRIQFNEMRKTYTGTKVAVLVLLETDHSVFTTATLERIQKLTNAFQQIQLPLEQDQQKLRDLAQTLPETARKKIMDLLEWGLDQDSWEVFADVVDLLDAAGYPSDSVKKVFDRIKRRITPISGVSSLANTKNILGTENSLDVNPIYQEVPQSAEALELLRQQVMGNDLFVNGLITPDEKFTLMSIALNLGDEDNESQSELCALIQKILDHDVPGPEKYYMEGLPVVATTISQTIDTDMKFLFPIVLTLVLGCLWFSFRLINGVLVPVLVTLLSLVCTLGLQALLGIPVNVISTGLPVFILSIGVADGIHMYNEYRDHLLMGKSKENALRHTIRELTMPVIMTSVTTGAAFLSLSLTEITQIRDFGWFVCVGTMIAMVFSLYFIPAMLMVLPEPTIKGRGEASSFDRWITQALEYLSGWVIRHARTVVALTLVVCALAGYGATLVIVDSNSVREFNPDSPLVIAINKTNNEAMGGHALNLLVETTDPDPDPMKKPENLQVIAELEKFVIQQPLVGKALSLSDLIQRINYVMHNQNPDYNRIPFVQEPVGDGSSVSVGDSSTGVVSGRELIAQYLLLYQNGGGEALSNTIDPAYRTVNISLMVRTPSSHQLSLLLDTIDDYARTHFPPHMKLHFNGLSFLNIAGTREIVDSQNSNFLLSLLMTFGLLWGIFRSVQKGLFAIMPLLVTSLCVFGIMGFLSVPLNIGTAVLTSIVIGIGVDYSIHFMNRLLEGLNQGLPFEDALTATVKQSGKAILFNAITVGVGFIALLFSSFNVIVTMGWMITITMLVSAMCTIILIPAGMQLFQPRFIQSAHRD
ncbi:MAG: RND family transporter [SAR324 cluster bacterium]|nr:RND family transporter [SAR324 cluster bacterium]